MAKNVHRRCVITRSVDSPVSRCVLVFHCPNRLKYPGCFRNNLAMSACRSDAESVEEVERAAGDDMEFEVGIE